MSVKTWNICIIFFLFIGFGTTIILQNKKIKDIKVERDNYKSNSEILLSDIKDYQTKDSLSANTVGVLTLKLSEYKKYRSEDIKLINNLKTRNRDLQNVTTTQMETINSLSGKIKDSIVYLPGDTVITVLRCIDIVQPWYEIHGCATSEGNFTGTHINKDSILIAATVKYKRFLGFLWKTNKVKDRKIDIVSKNPSTKIVGVQYIEITD